MSEQQRIDHYGEAEQSHYAEAVRLMALANGYSYGAPESRDLLAEAQVHATLAQVDAYRESVNALWTALAAAGQAPA